MLETDLRLLSPVVVRALLVAQLTLAVALLAEHSQAAVQRTTEWPTLQPLMFSDLDYPAEARAAGKAGVVFVEVSSDDDGRITQARPLAGEAALAAAATANARSWRLTPGVSNGVIVYRFEIADGTCNDDTRSIARLVAPNEMVITTCRTSNRPFPNHHPLSHPFSVSRSAPQYPPLALSARMFGVVVLEVTVGDSDRVSARPLTQLPFFTDAAMEHVVHWLPRHSGVARHFIAYEFALDNHACVPRTQTGFWLVMPNVVRLSGCDFQ